MSVATAQSHLKTTRRMLAAANQRIVDLDPGLKPEARLDHIAKIKAETTAALSNFRLAMGKLASDANASLPLVKQSAARIRAQFDPNTAVDAQIRSATISMVSLAGTAELLEHLRDAIRSKNIAKAEIVRAVFQKRDDKVHFEQQFGALFTDVVEPFARAREIECHQTLGVVAMAETFIREFASGVSDPEARMTAARAAGEAGLNVL